MKILLVGNPNVGKSVIFAHLTGIDVIISNYPNTTVSFKKGTIKYEGLKGEIIDAPGTYSLEYTNIAEKITYDLLNECNIIINVIDSTNLERNLFLTLSLIDKDIPMIIALNMQDEAKQKGIDIDVKKLENMLNIPIVPTSAAKGEGIDELVSRIKESKSNPMDRTDTELMDESEQITNAVQVKSYKKITTLEKFDALTIKSLTGIPIAILVALLSFGLIIGIGMGLRQNVLLPFFEGLVFPWIEYTVSTFVPEGLLREILIGHFGVLIDGIGWPLALVLPYLLSFYIVLAILEDSGYISRLAYLLSGISNKIGVHGNAFIPFLLGFGCTVGGVVSARMLETRRERFIVVTLMCIAIPCAAQSGVLIALLAERSLLALATVYLIAFLFLIVAGIILHKIIPGTYSTMCVEISPYRIPTIKSILKKTLIHTKVFIIDAAPLIVFGVFIASLLYETGALYYIGVLFKPIVVNVLGLPAESSVFLILGIIRRELALAVLLDLELTTIQLVVGAVVALFYIPCAAVFPVLIKEFNLKYAIAITLSTIIVAFMMGGIVNAIYSLVWCGWLHY